MIFNGVHGVNLAQSVNLQDHLELGTDKAGWHANTARQQCLAALFRIGIVF